MPVFEHLEQVRPVPGPLRPLQPWQVWRFL